MKKRRQDDLLHLIRQEKIRTQEELTERLSKMGYRVTQATVSRDIKELKIIKTTDENGEICYLAPSKDALHHASGTGLGFFKNLIHSVSYSVNIIVIHTAAGMAQGIAATIDRMGRADILGTIAGDDTIMVVCRTPEETGAVAAYLKTHL
ncbi:MAG: arginine repressor [Ruminococcaceae bacterium]|nr:arginine repressor [Oscillospiraceae bacterium]